MGQPRTASGVRPSSGGAEGLVEDYGFVLEGEDLSLDVLLDCPGQDDFLQIATFVGQVGYRVFVRHPRDVLFSSCVTQIAFDPTFDQTE